MASVSLISLLLLTASVAYWHVNHVTQQNNRALALAARVSNTLDQVPSAIRLADHALQDLLALPSRYQQSSVAQHIHAANTKISELLADPKLSDVAWHQQLAALHSQLTQFGLALQHLLIQYREPGWLYPAIPLIAGTMYDANSSFDTGLEVSIKETRRNLDDPAQIALYTRLVTVRDLWRRLILDFRSSMIQFAGQPTEPVRDSPAMRDLHTAIQEHLVALEANTSQTRYGFETAEIIPELRGFAERWFSDYRKVRKLQASGHWRGDMQYVDAILRPLQRDINKQLFELQRAVARWTTDNTATVRDAATDINYILWVVAGLALASTLLNYWILDRGLLRPVAQVSDALAAEAEGVREVVLPPSKHLEVARLISAFEHMRSQIQIRQQALEHQALHDVLTGLPNRALLQDRLSQGLRTLERRSGNLGLLLLDLDRFKEINDSLGHQTGDKVLQEVARRLTRLVRDSDTVARLGGDEFAVVLPGLDRETATELAQRIATTLDHPYMVDSQPLYLSASIGIVVAPEDGCDPTTLIRRADSAMYTAKRGNRDYDFYNPDQDKATSQGLRLTGRLRSALNGELAASQGLALHYQPRLGLRRNHIVGAEALLRWQDEDGSWIPPERIVRLAEHANMIKDLTRWVLNQALSDAALCRKCGLSLQMSVNLSAHNLEDNTLPAIVQASLHRHHLPASQLTLEVTESAVMADPKRATQLLSELAGMGVTLSIDDFGTGFSSLAYLSQLPVHELKIDKSFVLGMARNTNDAVIVNSIIDLAHNLDLQVVAEGVETDNTLQRLREQHCDEVQGYLISRPVPLAKFISFIKRFVTHPA